MTNEEVQKLVNSMYGSVGRSGIGQAVNQIDQGGYDYWANQLTSGALNPNAAQQTFSTAINQYVLQNPNDPYSQYISSYQKSQQPAAVVQPVAPTAVAKPVAAVPANPAPTQPQLTVEELYRLYAGQAPDAEGLVFWKSAFGNEITPDEVASFKNSVATVKAAAPTSAPKPTPAPTPVSGLAAAAVAQPPTATTKSTVSTKKGRTTSTPAAAVTPTASNPFPGMTVEDLYRMHAGKEPDAEGLAFWKSAFGPEISEAERAQFIKSVLEVQNKPAVQPAPAATSTATPAKPAAEQNKPTTLETLYKDVLGRTPSQAELDSWGFGSEISPEERDQFLYTAQREAINNKPKTGAVGNLAQQILGQNLTNKWSGEGWGSAENNAYDMAAILASAGITDISQFGRVEYPDVARTAVQKEFINMDYGDSSQAVETGKYFMTDAEGNKTYVDPSQVVPGVVDESGGVGYFLETPSVSSGYGNKVTGELIPTTHSGPGENSWGGTSAGKGDTSYGVQFDDQGKPVFYTQYIPQQNALAGFMSDLGPVGQIGLAIATGGLTIPQQIAAQAAIGLASGKDLGDIAKGALTSYALGGLSDVAAIKEGAQYLNSVDPSGALAGAFKGAVSSGVQAGVAGGNIGDAVLAGAVSGGVSGAVNSLMDAPEFKDLTAAQKRIASNAAAGVLTGKPLDQVVVNAAVAAARDAAKSTTGQQARAPAPVEDMGPTSYGTNVTQQLTDAGLIDEGGQFADAGSLTDADIAEITDGEMGGYTDTSVAGPGGASGIAVPKWLSTSKNEQVIDKVKGDEGQDVYYVQSTNPNNPDQSATYKVDRDSETGKIYYQMVDSFGLDDKNILVKSGQTKPQFDWESEEKSAPGSAEAAPDSGFDFLDFSSKPKEKLSETDWAAIVKELSGSSTGAAAASGAGAGTSGGAGAGAATGQGAGSGGGSGTTTGTGAGSGAGIGSGTGAGASSGSGTGLGGSAGAGSSTGTGTGIGGGLGTGSSTGAGNGVGSGSGTGNGAGSGSGSGTGVGGGTGNGQGAGTGTGSGSGTGAGTGIGDGDGEPTTEPPVVTPPVVTPPVVKPPVVKPPVTVPPQVVQQVALQLGVPATSQIAQDIAEALYGTMDYLDISEEFSPSARKAGPAATQKQMQQTKMAQGGYLDTMLAENMSVDDLLNLLR